MIRYCLGCGEPLPQNSGNTRRRCPPCVVIRDKERSAAYYAKHREKYQAIARKWRANHRVEHRAASKRWRETHREERAAYYHNYYLQNKEKVRAQHHAWWVRKRATAKHLPPSIPLEWPFIANARGEHEMLLAVNALLPRYIDRDLRPDVGNEILLAIWEKKITLDELKANPQLINGFIRVARKMNCEAGGHARSFDQIGADDRTLHDKLAAPEIDDDDDIDEAA